MRDALRRLGVMLVHPLLLGAVIAVPGLACGHWVARDERWQPRGSWNWAVPRELPALFREFNGIDFGHAHLAETLLHTQDAEHLEASRLEVLDFIFSSPAVAPDEEQIAPTFVRMIWEAQRAFNWAHTFHRSLYDLFASDAVQDKEGVFRELLANYLEKPEAITSHPLDHHGKLWGFPESKAFRTGYPKFNSQIWSYHWLQAATYDVQLMGSAAQQRELVSPLIDHYHGYLREPPLEWESMPMFPEAAPEFSRRFPEAAAVFDNLHMLHDNIDDVLSRPDLYPDREAQREAILRILEIYLHRNHEPTDRFAEYHMPGMAAGGHQMKMEKGMDMDQPAPGMGMGGMAMGPRPPSARDVVEGRARPPSQPGGESPREPRAPQDKPRPGHGGH